jgi:tRNA-binding EMAP/Myf-like protein
MHTMDSRDVLVFLSFCPRKIFDLMNEIMIFSFENLNSNIKNGVFSQKYITQFLRNVDHSRKIYNPDADTLLLQYIDRYLMQV